MFFFTDILVVISADVNFVVFVTDADVDFAATELDFVATDVDLVVSFVAVATDVIDFSFATYDGDFVI